MRVVLTQPLPRVAALAQALRQRGHEVLELPVRRLESLAGQPAVSSLLGNLFTFDWVVFVSPGAVDAAWSALPEVWPPGTGVATVGPGTEAALLAHGFDPAVLFEPLVRPRRAPFDAAALLSEAPFATPAGLRILVVRGEMGRDDWIDTLRESGACVDVVAVHRSHVLALGEAASRQAAAWLAEAARLPVVFVFTAQDAIDTLDKALPAAGRDRARALAVHPRQVASLRKCGWSRATEMHPGESGLVAGIESADRA
ncbi:MAG: uroporphyrinogen-III synthase [Burkholderiaceae bacterium]|nr:uroporphyrinogen-III synthase [Burkholderiaceae bacterium]